MNTPVTFEIAKLLKEKGFEQRTKSYTKDGKLVTVSLTIRRFNPEKIYYPAPTIAEAVMWLYEKHSIWIEITMGKDDAGVWFDWDIFSTITPRKDDLLGEENVEYEDDPNEKWLNYKTTYNSMIDERFVLIGKENYQTPTEAYEAAIEYTLNNLI